MKNRSNTYRCFFLMVSILLLPGSAIGDTIYHVKVGSGGDGSSWANAYGLLQNALDDAVAVDEIWVAEGTYYPSTEVGGTGDKYKTFQMKNGVGIYGGFDGTETERAQRDAANNVTILSGNIGDPGSPNNNCYHVFYHPAGTNLDSTAILDGFTITAGAAYQGSTPHGKGGGMHNDGCSPTVTNCIFSDNHAYDAGGMYNNNDSNPTVINCTFRDNDGDIGGGMHNVNSSPIVTNCTFNSNSSWHGGGMYNSNCSMTVTNCIFSGNSACINGGGISGGYNVILDGCTISGNNASGVGPIECDARGGGLSGSGFTLINCSIINNRATGSHGNSLFYPYDGYDAFGGGLAGDNCTLVNCLIAGNRAIGGNGTEGNDEVGDGGDAFGGGLYGDNLNLSNCTIAGNSVTGGEGGYLFEEPYYDIWGCRGTAQAGGVYGTGTVANCILWNNGGDDLNSSDATYSCIQETYSGEGNIHIDPLFVDSAGGNYRLQGNSPCIDTGDNSVVTEAIDLDGNARIFDGDGDSTAIVDMGAYEFASRPITITYVGQTEISLVEGKSGTIQINVYNQEEETVNWTISGHESCPWITAVDPNSGSSSGPTDQTTVTIEIDTWGLAVGDYECSLALAEVDGGVRNIPISLRVLAKPVGVSELALLVQHWLMTGCDPTQPCSAADWYIDYNINMLDFNQLAMSWLEPSIITKNTIGWSKPSLLIPQESVTNKIMTSYVTPDKLTIFYGRHSDPNNCWEIVEATRSDPRGNFTITRFYPELNGGVAPWLSEDRLRMYYCHYEIADDIFIIKFAERADLNSPWTLVRTISEIREPGYTDYRPVLTADELTMFWESYRPSGSAVATSIWMATRSSISEPFFNVTQVSELTIHNYNGPACILPDGLTIYFHAATSHPWMLFKATRSALQDPFTKIEEVTMFDGTSFDGHTYFVTPDEKDLYFYSEWMGQGKGIHASYNNTHPTSRHIHRGTAVVDGNLGDWTGHQEWIDLDQIYSGDPNDITEAKAAFRWDSNTNKVYAAVVVTDTDHLFTDDYDTWNAGDRIEIHSQGSADGGTGFYGNYGIAQHYMVGPDTTGGSWGTWALGQTIDPNANFEYAVQVSGNQITYEIGITQFDYYGGIADGDSILTYLYPGKTVRLDIIASTRHASDFGMLSENLMTGKYLDADKFAQYRLVE